MTSPSIWAELTTLFCIPLIASCDPLKSPTNPRLLNPCYSAVVHLDTLTFTEDSVTWEWTPEECSK